VFLAPAFATRGQGDLQPVQRHELAFGTVDPVAGIGRLRVARTASKIPTSSLTYGIVIHVPVAFISAKRAKISLAPEPFSLRSDAAASAKLDSNSCQPSTR
jgi:hypothetical protein